MFYTVLYGSHQPHMVIEHWKCSYRDSGSDFLILVHLNLSSRMWLLASIFDSTDLIRFWQVRWFLTTKCDKWALEICGRMSSYCQVSENKDHVFNSWLSTSFFFHSPSKDLYLLISFVTEEEQKWHSSVWVSFWSVLYRSWIIQISTICALCICHIKREMAK